MMRSLPLALATGCLLGTVAHADVPYWQYRYSFTPVVRTIAVDPSDPAVLYVGASSAGTPWGEVNAPSGTGIFRSTDGGHTWSERNNGLGNLLVTALVVDPAAPNTLYAGLLYGGVYKSTDAGASWSRSDSGLTSRDVYALTVDPTSPTTLYAGTRAESGGGVFLSVDAGASWTLAGGTAGLTVYDVAVDPAFPATVYAATGSGVRKSTDGGATFGSSGAFEGAAVVPDVRALVIDAANSATLLAGVYGFDSGIWRSDDAGASWQHTSTGLFTAFGNFQHITTLAQDPLAPDVFYASGLRGTFRSIDGGSTWANFNTGLARGNCPDFGVHAGGTIYAGSTFGELHRLTVRPSGVNHFRCFKAVGTGFLPQTVALADRFGTTSTTLRKPIRYCTPTDPMGEGTVDPTSHLVCYKLARSRFEREWIGFLSQRIDGYRAYRVDRPESLCVPATVGAPAAAPRDAYRCMDGPNWRSTDIDFTLADGYGTQLIRRHKLERLCVPSDLDGGGENRLEPDVDLRCDRLQGKAAFTRTTVTTTDRFGTATLKLVKPETHCFPALESRD